MSHKDLDVWKLGIRLVKDVYTICQKFPKSELYGLTSQLQRASVSVPANISEGAARDSNKEFIRFLSIAQGSLAELETLLLIAYEVNYIASDEYKKIDDSVALLRSKLINFQRARKKFEK